MLLVGEEEHPHFDPDTLAAHITEFSLRGLGVSTQKAAKDERARMNPSGSP